MRQENGPRIQAELTENDAAAGLKIGNTVFGDHCAKCDASNQFVSIKEQYIMPSGDTHVSIAPSSIWPSVTVLYPKYPTAPA